MQLPRGSVRHLNLWQTPWILLHLPRQKARSRIFYTLKMLHSTSQLQVRLETDSIRVTGIQVKAAHTKLVSVAFNIQRGPPSVLLLWLVIRGATICCLSVESILTCLRPPDPKKLHICGKTLSICKISSILWNSCVLLRHLGKVHFLNH